MAKKKFVSAPHCHFDYVKKIDGIEHYGAETTSNAGTHRRWLNKAKVDSGEIRIRNPEDLPKK